jgi:hypothetical protein
MKRFGVMTLLLGAVVGQAQDAGGVLDKVQIHGVLSQGFLFSSKNNYLTTNSSDGSLRWTEGAINFGTSVTDRLHVGVQLRSTSLGTIGAQKVALDWAYGDYKVNSLFGIRAGKVKTPVGLYNDIQDIDAVHPWALLPQSLYPADDRSYNLAHIGGVAYGGVSAKRAGSFSYQAYVGSRTLDNDSGVGLSLLQGPSHIAVNDFSGPVYGVDMRWNTPVSGLIMGGTFSSVHLRDSNATVGNFSLPVDVVTRFWTSYISYEKNKLSLASEYRDEPITFAVATTLSQIQQRMWYLMGSYHVTDKLTAGAYYSYLNGDRNKPSAPSNFIKDTVISSRYDFNQYFYCKLEGHYIDGTSKGFYVVGNPPVLQKITKLMVARVGFTF